MDLKPEIWISSTNHLEAVNSIIKNTPSWKRNLLGVYNLPCDFPSVKLNHAGTRPLMYFSNGELTFKNDKLYYTALKSEDNLLNNYYNLNDNLSFELISSNIKSIEWCPHKTTFVGKIKWNWIRIKCNEDTLDGDFLICADGDTNTENLFEMLNQFKEGQTISVFLNDFSDSKMPILGHISMILLIIAIVLDLIITATYGTINNIWGPIVVGTLFLSFLFIFISMIWYLTKMKENSKIRYHGLIFIWTILILFMINGIKNIFYP